VQIGKDAEDWTAGEARDEVGVALLVWGDGYLRRNQDCSEHGQAASMDFGEREGCVANGPESVAGHEEDGKTEGLGQVAGREAISIGGEDAAGRLDDEWSTVGSG